MQTRAEADVRFIGDLCVGSAVGDCEEYFFFS